jgi:GTP-binding protein
MFLDEVTLTVAGGRGGDGASSFRREAHVPRGGPDGGDGGHGGNVRLIVDVGETTLGDYRFKHHFRAADGGRGEGSRRHGKNGSDLDLKVPPGTVVFDVDSGDLLADLVVPGQRFTVAAGGRGGLGNVHFKSATHQAPKHATRGLAGEERRVRLDLRLIADVGLVGLPNAGKSTLLTAVTAATPKVADYPFTTLEPNLGVLDLEARDPNDHRRPTIADLPGLIEGASSGAGLGDAFLRHVERTRVLVHVVDVAASNPIRDFEIIRDELEARDPRLLSKTTLVVANKLDEPAAEKHLAAFRKRVRADGIEVVGISARDGRGIDDLLDALARLLPSAEELAQPADAAGVVVHRFDLAPTGVAVARQADGSFRVRGAQIEQLALRTNFDNEESAERFQRALVRLGVDRKLRSAGVAVGDEVHIGEQALEWEEDWA